MHAILGPHKAGTFLFLIFGGQDIKETKNSAVKWTKTHLGTHLGGFFLLNFSWGQDIKMNQSKILSILV